MFQILAFQFGYFATNYTLSLVVLNYVFE
jgi:hypothetical protein